MVIDPKMSVDLRIDAGGVSAVRTEMGRIGCAAARWTDHMLVCVVSLYVLYREIWSFGTYRLLSSPSVA